MHVFLCLLLFGVLCAHCFVATGCIEEKRSRSPFKRRSKSSEREDKRRSGERPISGQEDETDAAAGKAPPNN